MKKFHNQTWLNNIFNLIIFGWCLLVVTIISCNNKSDSSKSEDSIKNIIKTTINERLENKSKKYESKKYNYLIQQPYSKDVLYLLGENFYSNNEREKFYHANKILIDKSIFSSDSLYLAIGYQNIGRYFDDKIISDSAYIYFFKAKKIFLKLRNARIVDINLDIANLQYRISDYTSAEKSVFDAISNFSYLKGNDLHKYVAYNLLGIIYCEVNEFQKSIEYHNKALEITKKGNDNDFGFAASEITLNNIGNVYRYKKQYKKAIEFYSHALKNKNLFQQNANIYASLIDNCAYCYLKLNRSENSSRSFDRSLKIRDSLQDIPEIIVSKLHLSEFYCQTNDTPKAKEFAYSSYKLSKANKLSSETLMSLQQLINCNENIKANSQQYIKLNDSLQIAERKIRNKFARIAYETDEIVLQKDTAVKHKWITLIVAGSILLLLILLFIIKIQRAKQKELMLIQQQQEANENIYRLIQDQQIKINEARHLEKKRISQELHDGVMNKLTSTRLNLFILSKKRDDETINKCLTFINDIQNIEKEIRQVSHDLNSHIFSGNNSFSTLLESLFNQQRAISNANLFTEIDTSIPWETMESVIKMNLYRILQEAFQNCNKYAQATNIYVTISTGVGTLQIIFNDDGLGFNDKKYRKGIGLKNMKDRVDAISGRIDILSQKRKGTTIIVNLPIK